MKQAFVFLILISVADASAQTIPYPSGDASLEISNTQVASIPPSTASTRIAMVVDSGRIGDLFDIVTSNPNVAVSLILPNGTAITAANASPLGFTISTFVSAGSEDLPLLSVPGTHTLIHFTGVQVAGIYQVEADSSAVSAESALFASYFPESSLGAAIAVEKREYKVGDTVVLAGLLFDGTKPVAGAAMAAAVETRFALGWRAVIGGYTLVGQRHVSSADSQYTYSAAVTISGPAELGVTADVRSSSPSVSILDGTLVFGSVTANGTRASANTFTIQQSSQATFDPSVLTWTSTSAGTPVRIALRDSGKYDHAPGDGIYTGAFVPQRPGEYTVSLKAAGKAGGVAYSRTAETSFRVNDPDASFTDFADTPVDTDGNGLTDRIDVTATVKVHSPGSYRFSMGLRGRNKYTVEEHTIVTLATGRQRITLGFPASDFLGMGVDGPYERVEALLRQELGAEEVVADYSVDGGATQAYRLSSFDRGPMVLNGKNSATGIATSGGTTFDTLRVQFGVTFGRPRSGTSQWNCSWEGTLSDSTGKQIDFMNGHTAYNAGFPSGDHAVTLDFNGNRIARSGKNGPYVVSGVGLHCNGMHVSTQPPFSTPAFAVSQFTYAAADFALNGRSAIRAIAQGKTVWYDLDLTPIAGFEGMVNISATSLPPGATGALWVASIVSSGFDRLTIKTASTTPTGTYSIPVGYSSGGVAKTLTLTLTVTSGDVTIAIDPQDPGSLRAGQTQKFHASVANTSDNAAIWSLSSPIGTIDATGLYTAPPQIEAPTKLFVRATAVVDPTIYQNYLLTVTP